MTRHRSPLPVILGGIVILVMLATVVTPVVAQEDTSSLKPKAVQKWTLILPNETWTTIKGSIPFPIKGGVGFPVETDRSAIVVDTNGDGRPETKVKGIGDDIRLTGVSEDGEKVTYFIRVRNEGGVWKFAPNGMVSGRAHGTPITIIDQDNDGRYDGYGTDAMVVGKSQAASFLSKVVNLEGKLFNFRVNPEGTEMTCSPYEGEVGVLDLAGQFRSYGSLHAAIVSDSGGEISFNVAPYKKGLSVPVGDYKFTAGFASKGSETAEIRAGKMLPVRVRAGEEASVSWGAPVSIEFDYNISGDKITVPPNIKFYGAAGEEYVRFQPDAKSPKILVIDPKSKEVVTSGRFGGC